MDATNSFVSAKSSFENELQQASDSMNGNVRGHVELLGTSYGCDMKSVVLEHILLTNDFSVDTFCLICLEFVPEGAYLQHSTLAEHVKMKLKLIETIYPYPCSCCQQRFSSLSALTQHSELHGSSFDKDDITAEFNLKFKPACCFLCWLPFPDARPLKVHGKSVEHSSRKEMAMEVALRNMYLSDELCEKSEASFLTQTNSSQNVSSKPISQSKVENTTTVITGCGRVCEDEGKPTKPENDSQYYCSPCAVSVPKVNVITHENGRRHRAKCEAWISYRSKLGQPVGKHSTNKSALTEESTCSVVRAKLSDKEPALRNTYFSDKLSEQSEANIVTVGNNSSGSLSSKQPAIPSKVENPMKVIPVFKKNGTEKSCHPGDKDCGGVHEYEGKPTKIVTDLHCVCNSCVMIGPTVNATTYDNSQGHRAKHKASNTEVKNCPVVADMMTDEKVRKMVEEYLCLEEPFVYWEVSSDGFYVCGKCNVRLQYDVMLCHVIGRRHIKSMKDFDWSAYERKLNLLFELGSLRTQKLKILKVIKPETVQNFIQLASHLLKVSKVDVMLTHTSSLGSQNTLQENIDTHSTIPGLNIFGPHDHWMNDLGELERTPCSNSFSSGVFCHEQSCSLPQPTDNSVPSLKLSPQTGNAFSGENQDTTVPEQPSSSALAITLLNEKEQKCQFGSIEENKSITLGTNTITKEHIQKIVEEYLSLENPLVYREVCSVENYYVCRKCHVRLKYNIMLNHVIGRDHLESAQTLDYIVFENKVDLLKKLASTIAQEPKFVNVINLEALNHFIQAANRLLIDLENTHAYRKVSSDSGLRLKSASTLNVSTIPGITTSGLHDCLLSKLTRRDDSSSSGILCHQKSSSLPQPFDDIVQSSKLHPQTRNVSASIQIPSGSNDVSLRSHLNVLSQDSNKDAKASPRAALLNVQNSQAVSEDEGDLISQFETLVIGDKFGTTLLEEFNLARPGGDISDFEIQCGICGVTFQIYNVDGEEDVDFSFDMHVQNDPQHVLATVVPIERDPQSMSESAKTSSISCLSKTSRALAKPSKKSKPVILNPKGKNQVIEDLFMLERKNIETLNRNYHCKLCKKSPTCKEQLAQHLLSTQHLSEKWMKGLTEIELSQWLGKLKCLLKFRFAQLDLQRALDRINSLMTKHNRQKNISLPVTPPVIKTSKSSSKKSGKNIGRVNLATSTTDGESKSSPSGNYCPYCLKNLSLRSKVSRKHHRQVCKRTMQVDLSSKSSPMVTTPVSGSSAMPVVPKIKSKEKLHFCEVCLRWMANHTKTGHESGKNHNHNKKLFLKPS